MKLTYEIDNKDEMRILKGEHIVAKIYNTKDGLYVESDIKYLKENLDNKVTGVKSSSYWKKEAKRYCKNADYWRKKYESE